jgi:hypothetical protein
MTREITRRRVLALVMAAGLAPFAAAETGEAALKWLAEGVDASALRELGSQAAAAERSKSLPIIALLQEPSVSMERLVPRVRRLVLDDYTYGRTLSLSGWQISSTEAYLYSVLAQMQRLTPAD